MKTQSKPLDAPEEVRLFSRGHVDLVRLDGIVVHRVVLEPGWRWSASLKPTVGTELCTVEHRGYVLAGRLYVEMDDGRSFELRAGDAFTIESGHDACVLGAEECVLIQFAP